MRKKQTILIIVFAVLFAVLLGLYLIVIRPMLNESEGVDSPVDLLPGEALTVNDRVLMFEHVEKDEIQSIEVFNEYGSYKFYRDASDAFQLDGYQGLAYDQELFASLVVASGYTVSLMRVTDAATEADFAEYGLDTPSAHWTVTTTDGEEHTVYLGDNLITEGGYYARYEDRDAVYILSNSLESTILQPAEKLIMPLLTAGMTQNDYFYATNFTIWKNGEPFLRIANVPTEEMSDPNAIVETEMILPKGYTTHDSNYFGVLYSLAALQGSETVLIGTTSEILEEYGINTAKPAYAVYFRFNQIEFYIYFSEKQADGTYYATSNLSNYQLIAKVDAASVSWLEKSLFYWIADYPFNVNISTVDKMTIAADGVDVAFDLTHGKDENGNNTLSVSADVRAAKETAAPCTIEIPESDVYVFRQFYRTLLAIELQEYTPLTDEEKTALMSDPEKLLLTFTYTDLTGAVTEYKFYQYSTRRAFVTVNGYGEFYTYADLVTKAASDVEKVLKGIDIDSYAKN